MKKISIILLAIIMLLSFCACSKNDPPAADGSDSVSDSLPTDSETESETNNNSGNQQNPSVTLPYPLHNIFSSQTVASGYINADGTTVGSEEYSHSAAISVAQGDIIYITGIDKTISIPIVATYGADSELVKMLSFADLSYVFSFNSGLYTVKFTVPDGVASIKINIDSRFAPYTLVTKNELFYGDGYDKWYAESRSDGDNLWNTMVSATTTGYIPVAKGDKLYIAAIHPDRGEAVGATYSGSMKKKADISPSALTLEFMINESYGMYSYTIPLYVEYVRISAVQVSKFATPPVRNFMYISKNKAIDKAAYYAYYGIEEATAETAGVLYGKTALFLGDSITYGTGEDDSLYCSWAGRLGAKYGMTVVNAGDPGARISHTGSSGFIVNGLNKWTSAQSPDMIVMHGGVNDAINQIAIGQISADGNLDLQTFAGGLENMFKKVKEAHPTSALFYITNYHHNRDTGKDMGGYFDLAKEICEKYGVTVIDLYGNAELNTILAPTTTKYLPDKLHANSAAYDVILPYISTVIEDYYKA